MGTPQRDVRVADCDASGEGARGAGFDAEALMELLEEDEELRLADVPAETTALW